MQFLFQINTRQFLFLFLLLSGNMLSTSYAFQPAQETPAKTEKTNKADQEEQPKNDAKAASDSNSKDNDDSKLTPPIALLKQHQADIKHYLKESEIQPILVGVDDHIVIENKNTTANTKGTAILLPDWQQNATSPNAINVLRKTLPNRGWNTLTIQPLNKPKGFPSQALKTQQKKEENSELLETYQKRLLPILEKVMEQAQNSPGVLMMISQGNHAAILLDIYQEHPKLQPIVYVMLSAYLPTEQGQKAQAESLIALEIPVLDLYLRRDHPLAKLSAQQRTQHAKQSFKIDYRQKELTNITPSYYEKETLLKELQGWLRSLGW